MPVERSINNTDRTSSGRLYSRMSRSNPAADASLSEAPLCFVLLGLSVPVATCFAVCAHVPPPERPMHKKRAHCSFPRTRQKPVQRPNQNTWRKRMRPYGRISTHISFWFRKLGRISVERLVSVDANSRLGGFLPAAPKLHGFGICLPPQNAAYYTTTRRQNKTPAKIHRWGAMT